jgi:transcriptional regulator with XRE-family HTH domain
VNITGSFPSRKISGSVLARQKLSLSRQENAVYDRTIFRAVAAQKGDVSGADIARRLDVSPVTGWRLLKGVCAPAADVAARIEAAYGLTTADMLRKAVA